MSVSNASDGSLATQCEQWVYRWHASYGHFDRKNNFCVRRMVQREKPVYRPNSNSAYSFVWLPLHCPLLVETVEMISFHGPCVGTNWDILQIVDSSHAYAAPALNVIFWGPDSLMKIPVLLGLDVPDVELLLSAPTFEPCLTRKNGYSWCYFVNNERLLLDHVTTVLLKLDFHPKFGRACEKLGRLDFGN